MQLLTAHQLSSKYQLLLLLSCTEAQQRHAAFASRLSQGSVLMQPLTAHQLGWTATDSQTCCAKSVKQGA